jgi:hypothetical protein
MNKHVAKPKRKLSALPDDVVTEADMERHIRENRAHINELLKEAQDDIANGRVMPMPPLFEFLKSVRKQHKEQSVSAAAAAS